MIAKVLLAEKAERDRRREVDAVVNGIDVKTEEWVICKLRSAPDDGQEEQLKLLPPINGLHRLWGSQARAL